MKSSRTHAQAPQDENLDSTLTSNTNSGRKPQAHKPVSRSHSLSSLSSIHSREQKQDSANSFNGDRSPASSGNFDSPQLGPVSTTQNISQMLALQASPALLLAEEKVEEKIESVKLRIFKSLEEKYKNFATVGNFRDVLKSCLDHITDESVEVLSWTPKSGTDAKVGIHYYLELFESMRRVASEASRHGYFPAKIAHLRDARAEEVSYLSGMKSSFSPQDATIYIAICYSSKNHLTKKALNKVIKQYMNNGAAKVVVYLGRTEEINREIKEVSEKQLASWKSANQALIDKKDSKVQVLERTDWVKSEAYKTASSVFASLIDLDSIREAIEKDVAGRLLTKKYIDLNKSSGLSAQVSLPLLTFNEVTEAVKTNRITRREEMELLAVYTAAYNKEVIKGHTAGSNTMFGGKSRNSQLKALMAMSTPNDEAEDSNTYTPSSP